MVAISAKKGQGVDGLLETVREGDLLFISAAGCRQARARCWRLLFAPAMTGCCLLSAASREDWEEYERVPHPLRALFSCLLQLECLPRAPPHSQVLLLAGHSPQAHALSLAMLCRRCCWLRSLRSCRPTQPAQRVVPCWCVPAVVPWPCLCLGV